MYEVIQKERTVNGVTFDTFKREIVSANMLSVEAGTTGYQGGDTGHGGRTYFSIRDDGGTDIVVRTATDRYGRSEGFEVELGGDTELSTIIMALKFIVRVLEDQSKEVWD